ncbi:hypothetical protein G6F29_012416 [Rhizopus arrhizus]|nr:hypothetical protein G6F29_012416 [Rhizopus arrhizus]KAG1001942.1 hypothetical protein G6F27_012412 [Rhizopus arrhizus]KAG1016611.1 hypothetical protein G6F26_012390 [Rhizopus arrhizus]
MYSSSPYKFHCYCTQCSGGEAGKYQLVTRWTLARHKKKKLLKVCEPEITPEVNTNNEVIPSNESDSENDGDEDFSNWQITEDGEDDASSCMDIVEFNVPKVKLEGFQNDVVAFIAIFLTYFQLFFISEYAAEIVMKFANDLVVLLNYEPIFPAKLDTLRNAVGIDYTYKGMFRLVVCPECHTLYEPEAIHCDSRCTFS